jgi:hypothetical protein
MYLHNTYGWMNKDYTVYTLCLHNIITHYNETICFVFIFVGIFVHFVKNNFVSLCSV